jgi:hypothetical protein
MRAGAKQAPPSERIRHVRHQSAGFDARFFERHPDFWPIARAASTFADCDDWPAVAQYAKAFAGPPVVEFEAAPMRRRRPPGVPFVRENLYDAVIVHRRVVPTRERMWHDFLNALVWTTFPRSKMALHRRQHQAIERWIPQGATQLPNARTRELDALALVDEGGVLFLDYGATRSKMFFGHALFEGLIFEMPAMISRAVVLDARGHEPVTGENAIVLADALLSALLDDTTRILSTDELSRP